MITENLYFAYLLYTENRHIREFQYKILHGALYLNVQLKRYNLVLSSLCHFYNSCVESYEHFFFCSDIAQELSKDVLRFCNYSNLLQFITWKDVLRRDFQSRLDTDLNFVLLYIKYYLYIFKCKMKSLI